MKRTILSLGVVAAMAANTYGAGQVWYAATPNNANSTVAVQGAPGGQTQLSCISSGAGSWNITVHYTLADGGATGWALDHYGATPNPLTAAGVNVPTSALAASVSAGTVPNSGGTLMVGQNGANITPGGAPAGDYTLETFTLNASSCTGAISAGIGSAEFGGDDNDGFGIYEVVQIGSNVPRPGFSNGGGDPLGAEPIPVITITPEPSTMVLLAIGGIALIRRRK